MKHNLQLGHILIPLGALLSLMPFMQPSLALLMGIAMALCFNNPYAKYTYQATHKLLMLSIIGLGAGMNLMIIAQAGLHGIGYTLLGISATLLLGLLLGKLLKVRRDLSLLITIGTAICGGSAIAAIASAIHAKQSDISIALGIVFVLNAIALFIFPWFGHYLDLTQLQFGVWSALAIHDTSSVVGATLAYGTKALEIGTVVKLTRALWIVPLTLCIGYIYCKKNPVSQENSKIKFPLFILGFLVAAGLFTWIPTLQPVGKMVQAIAKQMLILTLFFIGINLSPTTLKNVSINPFIQGILLWLCVASASLVAVLLMGR